MDLRDLRSYSYLKEKDVDLAAQVDKVYHLVFETINGISSSYDNYTMHDMNHGLRVASYMEELAFGLNGDFEGNMNQYNAFEIALLLLSAILHDIGMFIRPEDRIEIKNNNIKHTDSVTYDGVLNVLKDENEAIKEIVRITHAARIEDFMNYEINGNSISKILILNNNYAYSDDIISICKAHGEDYSYLKTQLRTNVTKGSYTYNPQYLAVLLRIADYLDLDRQRTPILWYSMMGLKGFSRDEWEKHFIIQNEKKLKKYIHGKMQIYFDGKSSNAKIHRKYLKYIDDINVELENADNLLNTISSEPKYTFNVATKVDDCVETEGFKYSDLRLALDYSSITNLLMGKNIYGDYKLGLRELVQNSIDACKLMKEIRKDDPNIPDPKIIISYSKNNNFVKVKDTGIGMSLDIIKKHFLNVGKSYYKSTDYLHKNYAYKPIGQYGIGFLACFLLSDNVTVKTKYYKNNEIHQVELEKNSEYVVTNTEQISYFWGTEIRLDYNKFFNVFSSVADLENFLSQYFLTEIPIFLLDEDSKDKQQKEILNTCQQILETKLREHPKQKYDCINCKDYSAYIQGNIYARKITPEKKETVVEIFENNSYFYNNKTKKFELLTNFQNIPSEFYLHIKYAHLDEISYSKITNTRKTSSKKRQEILSLSDIQEKTINLFISTNEDIDFMPLYMDNEKMLINDVDIETLLTNSNLFYYEELLDKAYYFESVFISDKHFVNLQRCKIGTEKPYQRFGSGFNNREMFLYHKDIFVDDYYRSMYFLIPYPLEILGHINNSNDIVKLDVSRNSIINGYKYFRYEITCILLKYIKNLNITDKIFIKLLDAMIECVSNKAKQNDDD